MNANHSHLESYLNEYSVYICCLDATITLKNGTISGKTGF
jgi:hypothetical protein